MKCIIFIDKYSDWLEAYSALEYYKVQLTDVKIFFPENPSNDIKSIECIFLEILGENIKVQIFSDKHKWNLFADFKVEMCKLDTIDIAIAPFVRYRHLWALVNKYSPITVHLTEVIPDTFGPLLYRIAFRGKNIKSWLTIPIAYIFAIMHKPDICYSPFYPQIKNTFTKSTRNIKIPRLENINKEIKQICFKDGEKRPLLISGFGFDLDKMVEVLALKKYIATSKNKEIIVDGVTIPVEKRICAEEVMLTGMVSNIVGYNSTAMIWAKKIDSNIKIDCYSSKELNNTFGSLYAFLSKKALKKIGVNQHPEPKDFII